MLLEYQLDWIKIVDFLLIAKFWDSPNNLYLPSRYNQISRYAIRATKIVSKYVGYLYFVDVVV